MNDSLSLKLQTKKSVEELREILQKYEPWGHRVDFSNGVSTSHFVKRTPFADNTLQKIKVVEKAIPFERFRGGQVLDIGSNSGHNSIFLAAEYDMHPTGIDVLTRHIEVSNLLSGIAGIKADYKIENAETFKKEDYFDVILHFGTLYHLPNPLMSLENTYLNLKKGGYLALETQVYEHPEDENICYFMHMHNNDKTNFWALSPHVLIKYLQLLGFQEIKELLKVKPKILEKNMSRIILIAQK